MSLSYTLSSDDPNHYGTIKFNATPSVDSKVRYRVKSLSTFSMFSITTADDYIVISRDGIAMKHYFKDKPSYERLPYEVEQVINRDIVSRDHQVVEGIVEPEGNGDKYRIKCSFNANGMLQLTCQQKIAILDASHRVKMLIGWYNSTLPTVEDYTLVSPSMPLSCFGNVLYLRCKTGIVVGSNEGKHERYTNRCYKCLELLVPGYPLVSKSPGYLMTINKEDLSQLEFEMVDFQDVPIILHAPLHITVEVYYNAYDLVPINTQELQYNALCV